MRGNPGLDLAYACERAVPSQLQFRRDQPVLRIDGVILPECPIGAVARRLKVAHQRVTNLIAAAGRLCFGLDGRSYRSRFDNPQKSFLDGVVDTQSSECDAAWLAMVERTPPTGIARNVMLGACVADHQLASATPAADKAGEQSVAVLRRSVMSACGHVVAHHLADRLRALAADVTLMRACDQRQPFGSRLTTAPGSDHACGCIISCRDTTLTIGVGPAVDRVLDHPVDGRIVRPAPDHVAIMALGGQVQPMLDEPEQGLPDTAEFGDLVEDEDDGFLDTAIGILLEPVADLHEADRSSDDEFAAPGLLIAGRQGTLTQKIELILVEAALQSQQQPVIALTRRVDRLLIDQHGIDDAAHLDQLLPVTAVAGETRDFPRRDRTDLAQADLGHHSIKAGARDAACCRAPEIVIDRFDARPAQRRQTIAHRILQGAALAIVENLMGGGLAYIQDRLALQMVRPDLLRHHDASPPVPERGRRWRGRRSGGPSASSAYGASRSATAIAASAPRRRAGRRTDRTDVHCCEDGGER